MRDGDELIEVKTTDSTKEIFLVTKHGQCIRFHENDIRETGRVSMGVIGMNLTDGDEVIGMQLNTQGSQLLVVSEKGMGKRTNIEEFSVQRRGGKGVRCYKMTEKSGYVVGVKAVDHDSEIMMITTEGIVIRMKVDTISEQGRSTTGVRLINIDLDSDVKVASIAKVRDSEVAKADAAQAKAEAAELEVEAEEV